MLGLFGIDDNVYKIYKSLLQALGCQCHGVRRDQERRVVMLRLPVGMGMCAVYTEYRIGLSTLPWGTPAATSWMGDSW